jgi:multidrug efflux system membrane fusion protein
VLNRPIVSSALVCLAPILFAACNRSGSAAQRRPAESAAPVVTARVAQRDVPVDIEAIGNVEAYSTITVQSQVTGILNEVRFHEGDLVTRGQHLFTVDPRPIESALAQETANLARDQALLAQSEAALARDIAQAQYAQLQAARNADLNQQGIVSKDLSDQVRAGADAALATVAADRAAVASARAQLVAQEAAVANAKVQLSYTVIRSPIDGRTGGLTVKAGNLVTANNSQLTSIQQLTPIYVTFAVPAIHLPTIKQHMTAGSLGVVATPQDVATVAAVGALTFVDNAVDMTTDTIRLKATFTNADRQLWPGQFVRVRLRLTTLKQAVVVAAEAVQTGQDGQYVFVVKSDQTVEMRPVTVGEHVERSIVIAKGLKPGETVVTEGQLRLEPGSRVQSREGRGGAAGAGGRQGGRPAGAASPKPGA